MQYLIIISDRQEQYVGQVHLNETGNLQSKSPNKETEEMLANIIKEIAGEKMSIAECEIKKDEKKGIIISRHAREVSPQENVILYLEAVKNALRHKGFNAYLLDKIKGELLSEAYQAAWLPKRIKEAIVFNLQTISDEKAKELIQTLQEGEKALDKIYQEFDQEFQEVKETTETQLEQMMERLKKKVKI